MKGIAKKFGHEKTKILQKTGTIEKTHDPDFEVARETLEKLIKGITGLLRNAEKEDENILEIMDPLKTLAGDVDQFFGSGSSSLGSIDSALVQTDAAITSYLHQQKLMYSHFNIALTGLNIIKRKVASRDEKLLDYDKYRTKLHHAKEQQEKKLIEKYERKFGIFSQEYLQLNQDLKIQIEAEHTKMASYINTQIILMYQRQRIMYTVMNGAFHAVADADIVAEYAQSSTSQPVQQPKGRPRSVTAPAEESSVGGFLSTLRRGTLRGSGNKPPSPTPQATAPTPALEPAPASANTLVPPMVTRQRSASTEVAPNLPATSASTPTPATPPASSSQAQPAAAPSAVPATSQPVARRPPASTLPIPPGRRPRSTTLPSRPSPPLVPLPTPPASSSQAQPPARQVPSRPLPAPSGNHSTLPPTPSHTLPAVPATQHPRASLPPTPSQNLPPTPTQAAPAPKPTQQPVPSVTTPVSIPPSSTPVQPSQPVPSSPVQPSQPPPSSQSPSSLEPVQTTSTEEFLQLDELGYDYTSARPKSVMVKSSQKPSLPAVIPQESFGAFGTFGSDDFSTSSWGNSNTQSMFGSENQFS